MAESVTLVVEARQGRGSRKAQKLRAGTPPQVPGVVYGHKEATVSIAIPADALSSAIRHGARVVDLELGGKTEKALIRELQWDHLGKEVLHVDFMRVSRDERIDQHVPLKIYGKAPGVTEGGVLDQPLHTLHIECLAIAIPEFIRVNVGELQLEQSIHVRDLKLPEGVKALGDPEAIVVHVTPPKVAAEVAAAEAGTAEPEVIGRQKTEEEEGAEK
jgi:large subunit ribosomal protein L25